MIYEVYERGLIKIDRIEIFMTSYCTGEAFLYPNLTAYVDYIYDNYHEQIGSIRIGSNGIIEPSDDIIQMCKRNGVTVDISDYSKAVPELSKLNIVKEKLQGNGVAVDIKRTGEQWLDMGFPDKKPDRKDEDTALWIMAAILYRADG